MKDFVNRLEISNIEKSLRAELTSLEKKLLETQDLVEVRGKVCASNTGLYGLLIYKNNYKRKLCDLKLKGYWQNNATQSSVKLIYILFLRQIGLNFVYQQMNIDILSIWYFFINSFAWIKFQLGRGVPVIIPQDTIQVMKYLADEKVRRKAGIPQENTFLFANSSKNYLEFC